MGLQAKGPRDNTSSSHAAQLAMRPPSPKPQPISEEYQPSKIDFFDENQEQNSKFLVSVHCLTPIC